MRVGLLGPLVVTGGDGAELAVPTAPGPCAVLELLALRAGTAVGPEALVAALWGPEPPRSAVKTIQMYVSALRKALPPGVIGTTAGGYRLNIPAGEVDAHRFARLIQEGHAALGAERFEGAVASLGQAIGLWRGAPVAELAGQPVGGAEVARLEELRRGGEEDLAEARLALGEHAMLVAALEAAVAAEPLREHRWAQLMLALYRCGRQADALATFRRLRTLLADELGLEPSAALCALEEAILLQKPELDWTPPPSAAAPARPRGDARHNLPVALTSLVGRAGETGHVVRLVREHRAVTLTGPGGVGKTRLAVAAAEGLLGDFPDGVWFADLAPITDGALVAQVAADAIGVRLDAGRPALDALCETLTGLELLLILDNCEHVTGGCALLAERVLAAGPRLTILATSRERLRTAGEVVWPVPPLSLPDPADLAIDPADPAGLTARAVAAIADADAVRLFTERAGAAGPALPLNPADMAAAGQIAVTLDGLPLAIELAAARVATVGVAGLATHLDDRFGLLSAGRRLAAPRQQTLAGTIDWSYQMLSLPQQAVLNRLSVFAGAFALADAEAVVTGAGITRYQVAAVLGDLADHSLVQVVAVGDGTRYRLLETIRCYAARRLASPEGGEPGAGHFENRHASHYTGQARRLAEGLTGPRHWSIVAELELDYDNLRKALTRLAGRPGSAAELILTLAALRRYFPAHGHIPDAMKFLQAGLEQPPTALEPPVRTWALIAAAHFSAYINLEATRAYAGQALQLARDAGDAELTIRALYLQSVACHNTDDHPGGRAAGEEAVTLARTLGDQVLLGEALIGLALDIDDPNLQADLEEAVAVTRSSGDVHMLGLALGNLGYLYLARRAPEAAGYFREALTYGEPGNPGFRLGLGWIALDQGDLDEAATHIRRAARDAIRLSWDPLSIAPALLGLACLNQALGRWADAVAMLAFADRTCEASGMVFLDEERGRREELLARLHEQLGDQFAVRLAEARQMSRREMIDIATADPAAMRSP